MAGMFVSGTVSRLAKYFVLGVLALAMTVAVFVVFSYYAARTSLDEEIVKSNTSFEDIYQRLRNRNALAMATLESRCTQRMHLAAFRYLQSDHAKEITAAYNGLFDHRVKIVNVIATGGNGLIDVPHARDYLNNMRNNVSDILNPELNLLAPIASISLSDEKYIQFVQKIRSEIDSYNQYATNLTGVGAIIRSDDYKRFFGQEERIVFDLEDRINRLRLDIERNDPNMVIDDKLRPVVSKYLLWTETLLGSIPSSVLAELGVGGQFDERIRLRQLDCLSLEQAYRLATGLDLRGVYSQKKGERKPVGDESSDQRRRDESGDGVSETVVPVALGALPPPPSAYRKMLAWIFVLPPIAQTLLVTLILGALGAVTLSLLKLSRFGWWGDAPEPDWGEVLVAPLLGAIAAFGIFLVAKTGLLLTAGNAQADVVSLSAFFVGLLGFISGLLYDQAFARVRSVGGTVFGERLDGGGSPSGTDDDELAKLLEGHGAYAAAAIVRGGRLGRRLATYPAFTFFAPLDPGISQRLLIDAMAPKASADAGSLRAWFDSHVASTTLRDTDLAGLSKATPPEVAMLDRSKRPVAATGNGQTTVGNAQLSGKGLPWKSGVIQLIAADFS